MHPIRVLSRGEDPSTRDLRRDTLFAQNRSPDVSRRGLDVTSTSNYLYLTLVARRAPRLAPSSLTEPVRDSQRFPAEGDVIARGEGAPVDWSILIAAIELWPRLDTYTNSPDGCTSTSAQVIRSR